MDLIVGEGYYLFPKFRFNVIGTERLIQKSLALLAKQPDDLGHIRTFCRRLAYRERGDVLAKMEAAHALFRFHKIDVSRALPKIAPLYHSQMVQEEMARVQSLKNEREKVYFVDFSKISNSALTKKARALAHFYIPAYQGKWGWGLWKEVQKRRNWERKILSDIKKALVDASILEVIQEEKIRVTRSPEKKAEIVAQMALSYVNDLFESIQKRDALQKEILMYKLRTGGPLLSSLRKKAKAIESEVRKKEVFCARSSKAVVSEYHLKEKEHLRNLIRLESQFQLPNTSPAR